MILRYPLRRLSFDQGYRIRYLVITDVIASYSAVIDAFLQAMAASPAVMPPSCRQASHL
jgi:hypothetical protein